MRGKTFIFPLLGGPDISILRGACVDPFLSLLGVFVTLDLNVKFQPLRRMRYDSGCLLAFEAPKTAGVVDTESPQPDAVAQLSLTLPNRQSSGPT